MSLGSNGLKINVISKLHVLSVNLQNLKTTSGVRNTNVDLTIETAETTKSRINGVRAVGSGHNHNVGTGLHTVHEGEQLGNDTALDLTVGLLTLGGNGVDLINEDNSGGVLLGLLESLAQVGLGFTSHL